jgi:hypothetical protein
MLLTVKDSQQGQEICLFFVTSRTALGGHPVSDTMGKGGLLPRGQSGRGVKLKLSTTPWRRVGEWRHSSTFLDLCIRWRWVVSIMSRSLYPRGKCTWYPLDRTLGGPQSRSGRYAVEKNISRPEIEPRPSSPSLYRLSYPALKISKLAFILWTGIYRTFLGLRVVRRHRATWRKVADSIPHEVTRFFNWPNPSSPTRHGVDSASYRNEHQESSRW